jgi:ubiquitin-conjugating enzyme E2 S
LLIVPNAESALNEEAGKLLLEHYEDYFQRAKMMTEIHAKVSQNQVNITKFTNLLYLYVIFIP